jgi:hypothetical protein
MGERVTLESILNGLKVLRESGAKGPYLARIPRRMLPDPLRTTRWELETWLSLIDCKLEVID